MGGRKPVVVIAGVGTGLAVAATLLGERPFRFETVLEDRESATPSFLAPYQIVLETPIKLETEDCLWMGAVAACREEGSAWRATMQVKHLLRNLPELLKLASRFE